jgi:hypothetical protein
MPGIVSDIIVTPVWLYRAPVATALPADTLAAGEAWPAGWSWLGFTTEPLTLMYTFEEFEVRVQQTMSAVRRNRQTEEAGFETVLAEHTAPNMALAMAGEASSTVAGTSQPGKETFTVGGDPNLPVSMYGFEGTYVNEEEGNTEFPVRAFMWRATTAEGGEVAYDREEVAGIPLKLKAVADTSKPKGQQLLKIDRILEAATS